MGDTQSAKEWTPAEREAIRKFLKAIEERESQEAQGLMSRNLPEYFLDEVRTTAKRCASSRLSDRSLELDGCDRPRRNQHESTSYVYCWSDVRQSVFYVGKGHKQRAWDPTGHTYAFEYASRHLKRKYEVHLLVEGVTDNVATAVEADLLAQFGNAFVNLENPAQHEVYCQQHLEEHWAHCANRPNRTVLAREFSASVKATVRGEARLAKLREWVDRLRQEEVAWDAIERQHAERAADVSLLARLRLTQTDSVHNALMAEAVSKLVAELWRMGRSREVVEEVERFRGWHPEHFVGHVTARDRDLLTKSDLARKHLA